MLSTPIFRKFNIWENIENAENISLKTSQWVDSLRFTLQLKYIVTNVNWFYVHRQTTGTINYISVFQRLFQLQYINWKVLDWKKEIVKPEWSDEMRCLSTKFYFTLDYTFVYEHKTECNATTLLKTKNIMNTSIK